jgi:hypothetical protein
VHVEHGAVAAVPGQIRSCSGSLQSPSSSTSGTNTSKKHLHLKFVKTIISVVLEAYLSISSCDAFCTGTDEQLDCDRLQLESYSKACSWRIYSKNVNVPVTVTSSAFVHRWRIRIRSNRFLQLCCCMTTVCVYSHMHDRDHKVQVCVFNVPSWGRKNGYGRSTWVELSSCECEYAAERAREGRFRSASLAFDTVLAL